jgi:hypothetical protein
MFAGLAAARQGAAGGGGIQKGSNVHEQSVNVHERKLNGDLETERNKENEGSIRLP